ncbi:MAG: seryl-tRNA synthetase [Deltaproteobacteria bacterium]|nr:seryl-tRNA synthetase [Deltaproteobacteria bacterium]
MGGGVCFSAFVLDPRILAERRDEVAESCRRRRMRVDLDAAIGAYEQVARLRGALDETNRLRNEHQKSAQKKMEPAEREAHTAEGRRLKDGVAAREAELAAAETALRGAMTGIPNFVHPDVPEGGEDDSREIRRHGEPPRFAFQPLDHLQLAEKHDLLDFESGTRVAGAKFYYLKNEAVLLELALQRLAVEMLRADGFELYATPDLAKAEIVDHLGYNPRGEETQIYSIADTDLCLVGTAEITLGGLFLDAVLAERELPRKLAGISHCFRTEAGSYGRESKGLYRVHQFTKVEMFAVTRPEDSAAMLEHLVGIEERFFQALDVPYRVLDIAAGDLGAPAYRKYDIEAWMVGRGEAGGWGEVTSASNCTDYQARRLGARFRREGAKAPGSKGGKTEFVHMLNGTAVAITRALIAVLENHQQADGSIAIPKALQPYCGFDRIGR